MVDELTRNWGQQIIPPQSPSPSSLASQQIDDSDLDRLRALVRTLDAQLIEVIASRISACLKIGDVKRQQGLEVRNAAVEARVIASARSAAERRDLHPDVVEDIVRTIINYSVQRQVETRSSAIHETRMEKDRYEG